MEGTDGERSGRWGRSGCVGEDAKVGEEGQGVTRHLFVVEIVAALPCVVMMHIF